MFYLYIKEILDNYGIEIEDNLMFQNDNYNELKKEYILLPELGFVTIDYIIEKKVLSKDRINRMKSGYFDINVSKENEIEKLTFSALYKEIYEEKIKNLDAEVADKISIENIRQEVEGKHGLKMKLKENFNFDFSMFKEDTYNNLKLIKLIYKFHKLEGKLYGILGNPSMECVDINPIRNKNSYGETIGLLKNEAMKEVNEAFITKAKKGIIDVCTEWEIIIQEVFLKLILLDRNVLNYELERINTFLKSIIERLPNEYKLKIPFNHTVFETFYLKLIQYECIGRQNDLCNINSYNSKLEGILDEYINKYLDTLKTSVSVNELELYINENIDKVSELVYMSNNVKDEDKAFITKPICIKCIKNYLNIWKKNTKPYDCENVTLLMVISIIQEIIDSYKSKEEYALKYFGYKTEHPTLISKLKKGIDTKEFYQILWVRKVNQRMYRNLGLKNESEIILSIEKSIDKLISSIMKYHNLEDMKFVNKYFLSILKTSVINNYDVEKDIRMMANDIYTSLDYGLKISSGNVFNYFKETHEMNLGIRVTDIIKNKIEELEKHRLMNPYNYTNIYNSNINLELIDKNGECARNFVLSYMIDLNKKVVFLKTFWEVKSDNYISKMSSLGLSKFCMK